MNDEKSPDKELLVRLKAGDKTVFSELVTLYSDRILNTCYRFLLNREDAEDISQEVFIEIFQSVKSFRGDSQLSTWIYRIAVTKCLDEIKRRKRKKRITSIGKMLHLDDIAGFIGGGSPADKSIHETERMKEVEQALNKLPDSQRVAFTLSRMEGYSNPEIADIMKTTVIAVESLIYRAKKNITTELEYILKQ
jgi:RNA polymerase sigma-70 factor (ECF subfamily)